MVMKFIYVDTSMFMRACLRGAVDHAKAFDLVVRSALPLISSELLWLEADRAVIRIHNERTGFPGLPEQVAEALSHIEMIPLTRTILNEARRIPQTVKSLDAIHIASAEALGGVLDYVATADKTMLAVLRRRGVATGPVRA
jgi:predicted nucleic acid-binding protein